MPIIEEYSLGDDTTVRVASYGASAMDETDPLRWSKAEQVGRQAQQALTHALRSLPGFIDETIDAIRGHKNAPDVVELEFGVNLQAGTSVIVSSGAVGAALAVRVTWKRPGSPAD